MPTEIIQCPACQRPLRVPPELLGKNVRCPSCGKTFVADLRNAAPLADVEPEESFQQVPLPSHRRAHDDDDEEELLDEYQEERRPRRDYLPHRGTTILILGILSLVMCGILTGIPAWVMGNSDLRAMREGRMDPQGEGLTKAGKICGMVSVGLAIVGCMLWTSVMMLTALGGGLR